MGTALASSVLALVLGQAAQGTGAGQPPAQAGQPAVIRQQQEEIARLRQQMQALQSEQVQGSQQRQQLAARQQQLEQQYRALESRSRQIEDSRRQRAAAYAAASDELTQASYAMAEGNVGIGALVGHAAGLLTAASANAAQNGAEDERRAVAMALSQLSGLGALLTNENVYPAREQLFAAVLCVNQAKDAAQAAALRLFGSSTGP